MMTWTLYLLLVTSDGQFMPMKGRTYTKPGQCQQVAQGLKGRPVGKGVIVETTCKQLTHT